MKRPKILIGAALCGLIAVVLVIQPASATVPGITQRVVSYNTPTSGNDVTYPAGVSGDGRYVVIESTDINLVANDTNNARDIFVRDTVSNTTTRVSVASDGTQANSDSAYPRISYNGRYVVFESYATNLVPNDTNGKWDVFMHDMQTGTTTLVSQKPDGSVSTMASTYPDINADGRYVVFNAQDFSLDPNMPTNVTQQPIGEQVFVRDMVTGTTRIVSNNPSVRVNNSSGSAKISCDGGTVAFGSNASNLVPNDTNGHADVYLANLANGSNNITDVTMNNTTDSAPVDLSCNGNLITFNSNAVNYGSSGLDGFNTLHLYNRLDGTMKLIGSAPDGTQANSNILGGDITDSGRFVVFSGVATNLVANTPITSPQHQHEYIKDLRENTVQIVDITPSGDVSQGGGSPLFISNDGGNVTYNGHADLIGGSTSAVGIYQSKTGF